MVKCSNETISKNEVIPWKSDLAKQTRSENVTLLSRRRRFLVPALAGWVLNIRFTLVEPLNTPFGSLYTQLIALLPFNFKLDSLL